MGPYLYRRRYHKRFLTRSNRFSQCPEDIFPPLPARLNTMEEKGKKRGWGKSTRRGREDDDATVVVSTSSIAFLFEEKVCFFLSVFLSRIFCLSFLKIVSKSRILEKEQINLVFKIIIVCAYIRHTHTHTNTHTSLALFSVKEFIHSHLLLAWEE